MAEFETIGYEEYNFELGDLVVIGVYGENESIKNIGFECAKSGCKMVAFNLRPSFRDELEKKLQDATDIKGVLYIDYPPEDVEKTTIERIKCVCNDVMNEFGHFHLLIDFQKPSDYNEDYIKQLKQLAEDLKILITINADVKKTNISPDLSDLNNKALENMADVVIVGTDKQSTMVKNSHGRVGIFAKEENDNA